LTSGIPPRATDRQGEPSPLIVCHRGLHGRVPENTLASISAAFDAGFLAVEIDVHQTRDGVIVVGHDDHLSSAAIRPTPIASLTWKQLRARIPAASTAALPALAEVLDLCGRHTGSHVFIEVKGGGKYSGFEERLASLLLKSQGCPRVSVLTFSARVHRSLVNLNLSDVLIYKLWCVWEPSLRFGVDTNLRLLSNEEIEIQNPSIWRGFLHRSLADRLARRGGVWAIWGVEGRDIAAFPALRLATALITDQPELVRTHLAARP
jgi:glycerophosphoryl diester phosphodiesterase